jgi:hypothetical protein
MDRDQPAATTRDATITDTDELLAAAGFTTQEISAMRDEGVVA